MIAVVLALPSFAAPCATPTTSSSLSADLGEARRAFVALDVDRFHLTLDSVVLDVPCLSDTITPAIAADLHALQGVRWFIAGDDRNAITAFAAAKRPKADVALVDDLFPEGHAARGLWKSADPAAITDEPVPVPVSGATWFDGVASERRPDVPTVFQLLGRDGALLASAWLKPTDALPPYEGKRIVEPVGSKPPIVLLGSTAAAGILSGALYAVAAQRNVAFYEPFPDGTLREDVDRYALTTNALSTASFVSALGAAGLGVAAVVKF